MPWEIYEWAFVDPDHPPEGALRVEICHDQSIAAYVELCERIYYDLIAMDDCDLAERCARDGRELAAGKEARSGAFRWIEKFSRSPSRSVVAKVVVGTIPRLRPIARLRRRRRYQR